jgi:hypothetical protein
MRLALQRLLARPSSLEILRLIVGKRTLASVRATPFPVLSTCCSYCRSYAAGVFAVPSILETATASEYFPPHNALHQPTRPEDHLEPYPETFTTIDVLSGLPIVSRSNSLRKKWDRGSWTIEELEYESDVFQPSVGRQKLVDNLDFGEDINLWAFLWRYRTQNYGVPGIAMFWKAMRSRGLNLPVEEPLAACFWKPILELGFQDEVILCDIWSYVSELYESSGKRWRKLYYYVMEYMVLNRGREDAMIWHRRLYEHHRPSPAAFLRLFRKAIDKSGDLELLKQIYIEATHRSIYSNVVPTFLRREQYQIALDWHFLLISYGDLPSAQKDVEPLIKYFATHDLPKADLVIKSLVSAKVPFSVNISTDLKERVIISRETMNIIHGKTFYIKPKNYSDKLGSRWLATKWIPLDVAIETLHSLGVEEIGPLSLQAIALRESDPLGVVRRLNQLQEYGITTGNSVFSEAVKSFARKGEAEHLRGLLESDQHPDSLEDRKLQESLLANYALVGNRVQYAHTMAILLVGTPDPQIKEYNITLRCHVTNGELRLMAQTIENMRIKRIPVQQITINYILQKLLAPRTKGKLGPSTPKDIENLYSTISILKFVLESGWRVSVYSWREIIRRLGMHGRLDDLDHLCVWLARMYRENVSLSPQQAKPHLIRPREHNIRRLPAQIDTSDSLHPLKNLFTAALQRAIVEWGFIHEQQNTTSRRLGIPHGIEYPYTRGLKLLYRLNEEGVHIDREAIRRALIVRLKILYSPGESKVLRNRRARQLNTVAAEDMIKGINEAFREEILPRAIEPRMNK